MIVTFTPKKQRQQNILTSHIYATRLSLPPVYTSSSLSCYALRRPCRPLPYSTLVPRNIRSLLTSIWYRWHSYGQLMLERVRLTRGSACGCLMLLSMQPPWSPIHVRCVMSTNCCPLFGFAVFLIWLFSTCCWSYCPCLSERDNVPYSTVAAGNRATLWLSGCDTMCGDLIYSSSSPCMLSVRMEHDMSPSW